MRPTGRLHIGHYFGALQNWVKLQNDPQYECFFFVADWHALTSRLRRHFAVAQNTIEIATDWLASGLDPAKCTSVHPVVCPGTRRAAFAALDGDAARLARTRPHLQRSARQRQGQGPAHLRLPWLSVLQTADIVMYGDARTPLFVPVAKIRSSHVELSREIVRTLRFLSTVFNDMHIAGTCWSHKSAVRLRNQALDLERAARFILRILRQPIERRDVCIEMADLRPQAASWRMESKEFLGTNSHPEVQDAFSAHQRFLREPRSCSRKPPAFPAPTAGKCPRATAISSRSANPTRSIRTKAQRHDHRPRPQAPHRSRQSRRLPGLRLAQTFLAAGNAGMGSGTAAAPRESAASSARRPWPTI